MKRSLFAVLALGIALMSTAAMATDITLDTGYVVAMDSPLDTVLDNDLEGVAVSAVQLDSGSTGTHAPILALHTHVEPAVMLTGDGGPGGSMPSYSVTYSPTALSQKRLPDVQNL